MKLVVGIAVIVLVGACTQSERNSTPINLKDEAARRGLDYTYLAGGTPAHRLPEIMGGGVALFDVEQDGDLDVYFVQSGSLDEDPKEHNNTLFINDGSGQFRQQDGGDASKNLGYGMGVAVGDINNDALPDLFISQLGRNVLLTNEGNLQFVDITDTAGFSFEDWSTATAFADFDQDGDLDLWVVNYIEWSEAIEPECYQTMLGSRDYCSPSHYNAPAQDRVFRNDGEGRFVDVTGLSGVLGVKGNGLGIVTTDFNGDDLVDVFVANDTSPNNLWINQGDFQFVDEAALWNCAVDQHGVARAGMGIVATDLDDDRDQDVIIVHITTEPDYVLRNEGDYFLDITAQVGLGIHTQRYTRFGLVVDDLDNDGWLDVFEANGAVTRLSKPHNGDRFAESNSLYRGTPEVRFELVEYSEEINTSRGAAVGDIDNDGRLEIVLVDRDEPAKLLVNQSSSTGRWLMFDIRDRIGRPALGASVSLDDGTRTITRVVQRASSYLSSRDPRVHFGLGDAEVVENVVVSWPSGVTQRFDVMETNQIVTVREVDS